MKKASMKNILALGELDKVKIQNRELLTLTNDNVEDFRRTPYSVDKTE